MSYWLSAPAKDHTVVYSKVLIRRIKQKAASLVFTRSSKMALTKPCFKRKKVTRKWKERKTTFSFFLYLFWCSFLV